MISRAARDTETVRTSTFNFLCIQLATIPNADVIKQGGSLSTSTHARYTCSEHTHTVPILEGQSRFLVLKFLMSLFFFSKNRLVPIFMVPGVHNFAHKSVILAKFLRNVPFLM